jgi:DNA-binding winged helix-turn-helix (wHTH) protein
MSPRKNSVEVNPYFYGVPVRDPQDFYGRGDQLQVIFEALTKTESVSVVGERRSGRTSLLFYLMTEAAQHGYGFHSDDFVFLYLDPQLGIREPAEFFGELADALAERAPSAVPAMEGEVTARQIRSALKDLQPRRLVLLVDEFERVIGNENFPVDFFHFLRGISIEHEVRYVTSTTKRLSDCYWGEWEGSPLYNVFRTVRLGAWTAEEVDDFLMMTSERSGAPIRAYKEEILRLGGRLPFYVQIACSLYFDAWRDTKEITAQDRMDIKQRFAEEARPHFERLWHKVLLPQEQAALAALAHGQELPDPSVLRELTLKGYVLDGRIFSSALVNFVLGREAEPQKVPAPQMQQEPTDTGMWVDKRSGDVWVDGEKCVPPLTNLEYKLLLCLYDSANCICDKYEIVETVWAGEYLKNVDDSRIAKLVSRLRDRVEADPSHPRYIVTVHGRGYKLVTP